MYVIQRSFEGPSIIYWATIRIIHMRCIMLERLPAVLQTASESPFPPMGFIGKNILNRSSLRLPQPITALANLLYTTAITRQGFGYSTKIQTIHHLTRTL